MWETLLPVLIDASLPLVSAAISLAIAYLTRAIKTRLEAGSVKDALLEVALTADEVVLELEQVMRPELVKVAEDGKLSAEDGAAMKAVAVKFLEKRLSSAALKLVASNQGRLSAAIEAAVKRSKS